MWKFKVFSVHLDKGERQSVMYHYHSVPLYNVILRNETLPSSYFNQETEMLLRFIYSDERIFPLSVFLLYAVDFSWALGNTINYIPEAKHEGFQARRNFVCFGEVPEWFLCFFFSPIREEVIPSCFHSCLVKFRVRVNRHSYVLQFNYSRFFCKITMRVRVGTWLLILKLVFSCLLYWVEHEQLGKIKTEFLHLFTSVEDGKYIT